MSITIITKDATVRPLNAVVYINGQLLYPSVVENDGSISETGEYEWDLQSDMPRFHFKLESGSIIKVIRGGRTLDVYRVESEESLGSYVATHLARFGLVLDGQPPPARSGPGNKVMRAEASVTPQSEVEIELKEEPPDPREPLFQSFISSEEKKSELITRTATTLVDIIEGKLIGPQAAKALDTIDFFRKRLREVGGIDYDNRYINIGEKLARLGDLVEQARHTV